MSAASLQNKTLQLAELIVSNEKYADSVGYVASTASIESALTTISLNVPEVIANDSITIGTAPASVELTAVSNTLLLGGGSSILECGNITSSGTISTNDIQSDTSMTITASSGVLNIVTGSIGLFNSSSTSAVSLSCVDSVFTVSEPISAPSINSLGSITVGTSPASVELTAVSNTLLLGGGSSILGCGNITSVGDITLGATGDSVVLSGTLNTLSLGGGNSILECGNITSSGTISTNDIQSDTSMTINVSSGVINVVTGSIGLFNSSSTSAVSLSCVDSVFTVSEPISAPSITSLGSITVGTSATGSGILSVNASNQLLWNGAIIS